MIGVKAMSKRMIVVSVLLATMAGLACMPAGADVIINTSGATPFMYESSSYVPLQSVGSFLGARLAWDPAKGRTVVTYDGQDLDLRPGDTHAWFNGKQVTLSAAPLVINGRTYIPLDAFKKYYGVPVEWDRANSHVRIKGKSGWGIATVKSQPPWHGGPPPWAPAWGQRGKTSHGNHVIYTKKGAWKHNGQSAYASGKHGKGQGQSKNKGKGQQKDG
jgi:hypothetical protein